MTSKEMFNSLGYEEYTTGRMVSFQCIERYMQYGVRFSNVLFDMKCKTVDISLIPKEFTEEELSLFNKAIHTFMKEHGWL